MMAIIAENDSVKYNTNPSAMTTIIASDNIGTVLNASVAISHIVEDSAIMATLV
jgi:hypothetical protein